MANRVRLDHPDQIAPGASRTYSIAGHEITVVRAPDRWFAFDDRCPHKGARLSRGEVTTTHATCPLHGWTFDLETGQCHESQTDTLRVFPVVETDGALLVELPDEHQADHDQVHRYLVRFGAMGWTERLGSVHPIEAQYGQHVVVHTSRGLEVGELLASAAPGSDQLAGQLTGEVLRVLTEDDQNAWQTVRRASLPELDDAQQLADRLELELQIIDGELLLDEQTVVLYFLGSPPEDPSELLDELAARPGRRIQLESTEGLPLRKPSGCGSGGCGSGGCSSGGCGTESAQTCS